VILHVAGLDKFIPPFVELVKDEFKEEKQRFWFMGSAEKYEKYPVELIDCVYAYKGSIWDQLTGYTRLVKQLHSALKVMLHGLFNIRVVLVLALCPWVLPKCHWII